MPTSLHALIVEDRSTDAELMAHELRRAGFDLEWQRVDTPADYLVHLDRIPDVILSDYSLPQWNALAALQLLQQRGLDIPVIIVSGTLGDEQAAECIRRGAADYVLKDRLGRLGQAVTQALQARRLREEKQQIQVALQKSEALNRAILSSLTAHIVVVDRQGKIIAINAAWQRFACANGDPTLAGTGLGIDYLDVCRQAAADGDKSALEALAGLQSVLDGSRAEFVLEYPCSSPTEQRWFLMHVAPLADDSGSIVISHTNVTDRKRAELAVQTSEIRYRRLFEAAKDGILILDAGTNQIIDVNPFLTEMLGLTYGELMGIELWELGAFKDIAGSRGTVEELKAKEFIRYDHLPLKTRDGRVIDVEFVGNIYMVNDQKVIQCNIRDITARRRAEAAQAAEHSLLRTVIDSLPDRIYAKDTQGRFILKNQADVQQIGAASPEEVVGKTDFDYYPPELAQQYHADDLAVIQSGQPMINREEKIIDARGTEGWILTSKVPLRDQQGQVAGLVGIGHDITRRKQAEAALKKSEAEYRRLFENASVGIFHSTPEGKFLKVNPALAAMLGYESPEDLVTTITDIAQQIYVDSNARTVVLATTLNESGWVFRENRYRRKDGGIITARLAVRKELNPDGTVVYLEGFVEDITERKRLEDAEHEQRVLAETLLDTAEALANLLDPDIVMARILENVGRVVPYDFCNLMLIKGETAQVVYCRGWSSSEEEAALTASFSLDLADLSEMIRTRAPLVISDTAIYPDWRGISSRTCSYMAVPIQVHGTVIGFLSLYSVQPGFFSASLGERLGAFATQAAIALENAQLYGEIQRHTIELEGRVEQRTAELNRAKEHVEAILDNTSDAIVVTQLDGIIEQTNPAFASLLGYQSDEAIRLPLTALVAPVYVEVMTSTFYAVCADACPQRIEIAVLRHDGTIVDVEIALSPILGPDRKPYNIVCILHDIVQRKKVERDLQELNRLKTEFLSTAAHELRTPLTGIRGFSELLLTRILTPDRHRRYLELINEQATQLGQLIDNLLDISRMEAKRSLALTVGIINLAQLVDEVLMPIAESALDHDIQLEGLQACPPLTGDSFRLGQVFKNLLSNAIKYSPKGGKITLVVQTIPDYIQVSVKDEGIGMTAEQQAHLFEKFYRANTDSIGTGLGLVVCKNIIELHGGRIWAESQFGVGTTFHFTLPTPKIANSKP